MKRCFKCGQVKPVDEFYRHSGTRDGRLGKCKACTKRDVSQHYYRTLDHQQEYEQERNQRMERKVQHREYLRRGKVKFPEKYRARQAVANAVRDGRLLPYPCVVCGMEPAEAHHPDYSHPLDVVWLCRKHHREEHKRLRIYQMEVA